MESIPTKALKDSSLLSEGETKLHQQMFIEDLLCVTTAINSVPCEDFAVDDLFDFSDKDFNEGSVEEFEEDEEKDSFSLTYHHRSSSFTTFSGAGDLEALSAGELAVPVEDLENLEWLSQFVDDSSGPEFSLLCPADSFKEKTGSFSDNWFQPLRRPVVQKFRVPCFSLPVPRKMRSKRSRPNGSVWSLGPLLLTAESCSPSSSSYGSSTCSFAWNPVQENDLFSSVEKPPAKKLKRKPAAETASGSSGSQTLRRCSHCQVQKTPQWRTGPLGPKTLCNACGVRYKSGRLFPEYRPACSPTFSQEIHSNSHRKVLEMRRQKETAGIAETGLAPMVPSF